MLKLRFRKMMSGVPLLSRNEIDILGEALVYDFCKEAMEKPQAIDIDMFCEKYLGLNQDFKYLSNSGIYLGMMVFHDTDRLITYNKEKNCAQYSKVKGNTVIIERSLLGEELEKAVTEIDKDNMLSERMKRQYKNPFIRKKKRLEHRYRFTMAHETAGHAVLHREYFDEAFRDGQKSVVQCQMRSLENERKDIRSFTDYDWMEWQADKMASSFLMPATMVRKALEEREEKTKNVWEGYQYYCKVLHISDVFNVSIEAATIRLKQLHIIPQRFVI